MSYGTLTLTLPDGETAVVELTVSEIVLGRSRQATVRLQDDLISKQHLRLTVKTDGVWLEDLGATNGTFVDDEQLPAGQPARLQPGQTVQIGDTLFTYAPAKIVAAAGETAAPSWRQPLIIGLAILITLLLCVILSVTAWWLRPQPNNGAAPATGIPFPGTTAAGTTAAATPTAEPSQTAVPPTPTPSPTSAAPTPTGNGCEPTITVLAQFGVNVRRGPGLQYDIITTLPQGETAPVIGQNGRGSWWRLGLETGGGTEFWVAGDVVEAACTSAVPILPTPPPPTSTPTPTATPTSTPTSTPTATATPTGEPDVNPPLLSIVHAPTAPTGADEVTFTVQAVDESAITRIELWVQAPDEGGLLRVKVCQATAVCVFSGGPYAAGTGRYQALAWDAANNQGETAVFEFTVTAANP
jgi:hypothetical protein